jgi:hypothetical protein
MNIFPIPAGKKPKRWLFQGFAAMDQLKAEVVAPQATVEVAERL